MKKILKYGIPALVIVLILCVGASYLWFTSPGVHSFAGYTYVNISDTVYFVDGITEEVGERTTVTIKGLIPPAKAEDTLGQIDATMSCAQYPAGDGENVITGKNADGMIGIYLRPLDGKGTQYWLQMSADDPNVYALHIYLADGESVTAHPGETAEAALENYRDFWAFFDSAFSD